MVVGPFSLSSTTNAWAEFDLFLDVEYGFDEAFWVVSTDGLNFDGYVVSPGPNGRAPPGAVKSSPAVAVPGVTFHCTETGTPAGADSDTGTVASVGDAEVRRPR